MLYSPTQLTHEETGSVHVLNPSMTDFSMEYLNDRNEPQTINIPALATQEFPKNIGTMVITHLANHILNLKEFHYKTDVNLEIAKIKKEITIG